MTDHENDLPERPIRIDGTHPAEEVYLAFPDSPPVHAVNPTDGLPRQVVPTSVKLAQAPTLRLDNLICMADTSNFVVRNHYGLVVATYSPDRVRRFPDGRYYVETLDPDEDDLDRITLVEPIRPQCQHYVRQLVDFPDDPDFKAYIRLCSARRTDSGEFLSVRDMAVFACELREPRDPVSEQIMDAFDQSLLAAARQAAEIFDVDAALTQEGAADLSGGGIFSTTVED